MDDIRIKQEFENTIKVKQDLGTSGPLDNFKSECIEEVNNDCTKVKQETEDSSMDSDTYENTEQDVKVSIKSEVEIVDVDYSEERSNSACDEEVNNDYTEVKQETEDSSMNRDTYKNSEQDVKLSIKSEIKSEVEIDENGVDYSKSNSACDAESSKEVTTGSDIQESLKVNKSPPESKNDSKLSKDIYPTDAVLSGDEKQYNCKICDKSFVRKYYFDRHVQCHSETDMLKCIHCDKKYLTVSNLKTHLLIHSDKKTHKCELCSKEFRHSHTLQRHMLIHSDKKTHKCELCSKEFKHYRYLKLHNMLIHSGGKQYKCAICCKSFSQSGHLKSHLLMYSDKKLHKCELCSREFKRYQYL